MKRSILSAAKPNLLLCFDAFGTLFSPKCSVAQQYAEIARECGITSFSDLELERRLLDAIKEERKQNPNYGKATGLGATGWWTNVIHKTFTPLIRNDQKLPSTLVPKLIHRFASNEGYNAERSLIPTFRALRQRNSQQSFDKIVIGVVTNSDDRVPSILSSFGLNVSPLRYGTSAEPSAFPDKEFDIDFHCMSYDVGIEKPDRRIFSAAELMLSHVITARNGKTPTAIELESWQKVYVGDEYAKDVVGALNAGWNPVLLDAEGKSAEIPNLEDCSTKSIADLFEEHPVVRIASLQELATWLTCVELQKK